MLFVLAAQFLFGTTFAFNKYVIQQNVDPILLGFNRMVLATLCFLPFYRRFQGETRWIYKDWILVFLVGSVSTALAIILEYVGTKYTTASNASLLISTEAVVSVFLAVLILKERLQMTTVAGGIFSVIGMVFVMYEDIQHFELQSGERLLGDSLILASVFAWGLYTVGSKKILNHSSPIYTLFFMSLFTTLSLGLINLFRGSLHGVFEMSLQAWLVTLYLGIFCSGLAHFFYYQALKRLPASVCALTLTLLPVFGVIVSMLLLKETLSLFQLAGAVTIVIGVGYALWPREETPDIPIEPPVG